LDKPVAARQAKRARRKASQKAPHVGKNGGVAPGQVARIVRQIISQDVELKYQDTTVGYGQVDKGGVLTLMTNMSQGVGQGQRVGDKVRIKAIDLRLTAYYFQVAAVALPQHEMRVTLFKWNLATSVSTPALGVIYQNLTANVVCSPFSWQGLSQNDFVVIYDEIFSVGAMSSGIALNKRFELNSLEVFDPASTNSEGAYYLYMVGDDVTGAHTPNLQAQFMARTWYEDA